MFRRFCALFRCVYAVAHKPIAMCANERHARALVLRSSVYVIVFVVCLNVGKTNALERHRLAKFVRFGGGAKAAGT